MSLNVVQQTITQLKNEFDVVGIVDCDVFENNWIDLYIEFKKLHKEAYQPNERIIVKTTFDYYNKEDKYGKLLQSVQLMLNDIDISNFFVCLVTTNSQGLEEYNHVLNLYSTDSVPFTVYECDGEFARHEQTDIQPFRKIASIDDQVEEISKLSREEKHLLFQSKTFCIAPWTSMCISTENRVTPCPYFTDSVANTKLSSLGEIWNNHDFKSTRQKMLAEEYIEECKQCYNQESKGRDSLRTSFNRRFSKHIAKISETSADGYLNTFELAYLDARFNNTCNLSCRSCGPASSSSWHDPAVYLGVIASDTPAIRKTDTEESNIIEQIGKHIHTLESVLFSGGEPLLVQEFYDILSLLDDAGRHDIKLIYNTNLTKTHVNGRSIFDAWKNFKNISIGASLDAEADRAEYLRCGTNWQDVLDFRRKIIETRPDIDFVASSTISIINALHVPDFHRSWVDQGLILPEQYDLQLLFSPEWLKVENAPKSLKDKIRKKYNEHLEWLRPLDKLGRATYGFESVLRSIESDREFDKQTFWNKIKQLDEYYKKDLLDYFPELEDLK